MKPGPLPPPLGWGADALTGFLENQRLNQYATFVSKPVVGALIEVDAILRLLLSDLVDPRPMFPMQFMLRSHATFVTSAGLAMAGQLYESTVLQRSALETSAYGVFIGNDADRAKVWLARHDSNSKADEGRKLFGFGNLKRHLEGVDPILAASFANMYEASIDFGAHPNERGILFNVAKRTQGSQEVFDTVYLHGDGPQLDFALKSCVQVGIWLLLAFRALYPSIVQTHGVESRINDLLSKY